MREGIQVMWRWLASLALLMFWLQPLMAGQTVSIGILAEKSVVEEQQRWQALATYLSAAEPDWEVSLQVMPLDELDLAIVHHRFDFILTEPSHYTRLQRKSSNSRALATIVRHVDGRPVYALAGAIIARTANRQITDLSSLRGRRIAVMSRDYLASYQAQLEILVNAGIPASDLTRLLEVEPHAEAVVHAVMEQQADVGFVSAGIIEYLIAAGRLANDDIKVIHHQLMPGYPYAASTRLYPEWPLVALPAASPEVARKITALLMNIESDNVLAEQLDIHGFIPPAGYVAVDNLARELRLPPFDVTPEFTVVDIWSRYQLLVVGLLLIGGSTFLLLLGLMVYNRNISNARGRAEQAAVALEQSRERFDLAMQAFDGGLWDWNLLTNEVYFSLRWKTMLGYADEELDNAFSTWELLVDPADKEVTLELINDCVEGRRNGYVVEFRMRHKSGGWRIILSHSVIVRDVDGKALRMVGTHSDITDRTQIEEELAEAQRIAHVGHWRLEHENQRFTCSNELDRIFERDRQADTANYQALMEPIHPHDRQWVEDASRAHFEQGEPFQLEHRLLLSGGRVKYIAQRCETEYDPEGHAITSFGVVLDITAQKALGDQLRASEASLRGEHDFIEAVLDAAGSIIMVTDKGGRVVRFNRAAEKITGYQFKELQNQLFWTHVIPHECAEDVRLFYKNAHKEDFTRQFESEWLMKNGSRRLFDWRNTVLTDMAGEVTYVIAQGHDVTDKKAAEEALYAYQNQLQELVSKRTVELEAARQEAERLLKVKSEFLSNMSHEIRTPLNAVLGLAQIGVHDSVGTNDKAHLNYRRILDSGQHLLGLINDILDFSKMEAGKLVLEDIPFRLGDCIDRAVSYTSGKAHTQGLEVVVLEDPELPLEINGDITRLTQVLVNLLDNAAKFTEQGRLGFSISVEDDALLFNITDTGIGMSEEQRITLFAPFEQANSSTTRRFGGTGLGMAISKRLVDEMGGKINVFSWEGVGTSIGVRLPLARLNASQPRVGHSCRAIRMAGFSNKEIEEMGIVLEVAGIHVTQADLSQVYDGLEPDETLLLSGTAFASPDFVQQTSKALSRAVIIDVLCRPDKKGCVPEDVRTKVRMLDWPLRARLLSCVQPGADLSIAKHGVLQEGRLRGLSVLVAEDNDINQIVLEDILQREKAEVRFVENGQLLLDILDKEGADKFDLVLMDIQMPVMGGHEATRKLLARTPTMPVIGLTAHALIEERESCLASGMLEHVTKPIVVDVLIAAILRHVPSWGLDDEADVSTAALAHSGPQEKLSQQTRMPPEIGDNSALIDWPALKKRFGHRQSFIDKLLTTSTESMTLSSVKLQQVLADKDIQALAFQAHSLKGAAGNIMATRLFELASETDALARDGQAEAWSRAKQLSVLLEQLLRELVNSTVSC